MSSQNIAHYFSNASNTTLHNPTFTHVNGNAYFGNSERHGLRLLLDNISSGAFHDAAERGDPPRCHPQTRTAIRAEIMEWIQAPIAMRKLILWVYGPAGSGKTAIAQSIAEECKKQGLLAASFFFGRTAPGRNDSTRFVTTIAYQLSRFIPETCEHIISAIEQNPTIFSCALATQIQALVIEPLKSLPPSSRPIFIVTDGVDECGPNRESQADILNALGTAISVLQHIPVIFMITSRPEYEIRDAFEGNQLSSLVKRLSLDDNYKPDKDIRLYIESMFQEIRDKHLRLGNDLPSPWPAENDVDILVSKASGQFIFAATVMKFIAASRHYPPERLNIILGLSATGNETPFALLDALYHYILSSVADVPKVLEILTLFIMSKHDNILLPPLPLKVKVIEALLGISVGRVLVDMHALVFVPPPADCNSVLRIHHASLYDFLTDRSRSQSYYIDPTQGHITLGRRWLKLAANYRHIPKPLILWDCINNFVEHCKKLLTSSSEIVDELASFSLKKLLGEISRSRDFYCTPWNAFFATVEEQAGSVSDVFLRLRGEFDSFFLGHLSQYPPTLQAVIPAILVYGTVGMSADDIFRMCLHTLYPTETDLVQSRKLDSTLLGLYNVDFDTFACDTFFSMMFRDLSRCGQYCVDDKKYAMLLKHIVTAAYPLPSENKHRVKFVTENKCRFVFDSDGSNLAIHIPLESLALRWFPTLIGGASPDLELAMLLREHVLQFDDTENMDKHYKIAKIGWEYIQRCHIAALKHSHRPDTNRCFICDRFGSASIVVDTPPSLIPARLCSSGCDILNSHHIRHFLRSLPLRYRPPGDFRRAT